MRLLLIADDFTGALDTGVQFVKNGALTEVFLNCDIDYKKHPQTEVFVVDTETRHLSRNKAYETVYGLVKKAVSSGIEAFYKKTDSGLRGNIGPEIEALSDALQETVFFAPAFPSMNRIVRGGISYIDDVPVNKSVFGKDPFEPVTVSFVKDLFRSDFDGVRIFDAETNEDMNDISQRMLLNGPVKAVAGCAGLASFYAAKCRFGKNSHNGSLPEAGIHIRPPFLICCGSLNTVSVAQIKAAASEGWPVAPLPKKGENDSPEFKNIQSNLLYENICIVESFSTPEGKKEDIAERFGNMICKAADSGLIGTLNLILYGVSARMNS